MKFKKGTRVFGSMGGAASFICSEYSDCDECPLSKFVAVSESCIRWAELHPEEFATACGFEIIRKDEAQEAKADAGKLQIHMVPMQIVRDIAEVRMYGTNKYGGDENNWRKVELMRYVDALLRHTLAFAEDIHSVDEESGIPHYKHAECNLAFISELLKDWKGDADGRVCNEIAEPPGD